MYTFDRAYYDSCISRGMYLLRKREKQMIKKGYEFPINVIACKNSIEQAIINRESDSTMMQAVIKYIDKIEDQLENFNGI